MTSFVDHRTIVVGLFLPTSTAAAFHPNPVTPGSVTPSNSNNATEGLKDIPAPTKQASLGSTEPPISTPATTAQKSPTATKFSTQRPTHHRHASSMNLLKQPSASIVDDLLAAQKPTLNIPPSSNVKTNTDDDEEEEDTTPRRESANPFASFAASSAGLGTEDRAEIARGRDRGDVQIDTHAQTEAGGTQLYRRLSRKQSKVGLGCFTLLLCKY